MGLTSIQFTTYENLPKNVAWKIKGEALFDGYKYYMVGGIQDLNNFERVIKLIQALALTILTSGLALISEYVCNLWKQVIYGRKPIMSFIEVGKVPEAAKKTLGLTYMPSPGKAQVFKAGKKNGIMVEYVDEKSGQVQSEQPKAVEKKAQTPVKISDAKMQALEDVKESGLLLNYLPDHKDDEDVVKAAVSNDGLALKYASTRLQEQFDIVMLAVKKNGLALEFASKRLREDKKVVEAAVKQNGLAIAYASETLRSDEEMVLVAVSKNGRALREVSSEMKKNFNVVLEAVKRNGLALAYASNEMRENQEIIEAALKQNPEAAKYVKTKEGPIQLVIDSLSGSKDGDLTFSIPGTPIKIRLVSPLANVSTKRGNRFKFQEGEN